MAESGELVVCLIGMVEDIVFVFNDRRHMAHTWLQHKTEDFNLY